MNESLYTRLAYTLAITALALSMSMAGTAFAAAPRVDEAQLLELGFKVLVATTTVQEKWVKGLAPGQIRPMQRNGKKFYIYPDAGRNQIYVGGPQEYERFRQLYPETQKGTSEADTRAYRLKQDEVMRNATARDLSNPFLGASWADLGW